MQGAVKVQDYFAQGDTHDSQTVLFMNGLVRHSFLNL